jgi:recombination protein RecA
MFGNPETTTGGRALKFYASIRIELRRSELIKSGNDCIGIRTCAKVIKNKVAPPLYKAYIDIYFDKGFDHTGEVIDFALEKGIIAKRGTWYYFNDDKIGQGKEATRTFLLKNVDLFESIKQKTLQTNGVEVNLEKN